MTGLRLELENALILPDVDHREVYETALSQLDRLESTIDEMLSLAREEAIRGEVDVSALVGEFGSEWHGSLASQGRRLHIRDEAAPVTARASSAAVRQILDVLLSNADQHGAGTVSVTVRRSEGAAVIEVSDEGNGVAASSDEIFKRRGSSADGHGIGLALARSLAEAEGGRLLMRRSGPHPIFELTLRS